MAEFDYDENALFIPLFAITNKGEAKLKGYYNEYPCCFSIYASLVEDLISVSYNIVLIGLKEVYPYVGLMSFAKDDKKGVLDYINKIMDMVEFTEKAYLWFGETVDKSEFSKDKKTVYKEMTVKEFSKINQKWMKGLEKYNGNHSPDL